MELEIINELGWTYIVLSSLCVYLQILCMSWDKQTGLQYRSPVVPITGALLAGLSCLLATPLVIFLGAMGALFHFLLLTSISKRLFDLLT